MNIVKCRRDVEEETCRVALVNHSSMDVSEYDEQTVGTGFGFSEVSIFRSR